MFNVAEIIFEIISVFYFACNHGIRNVVYCKASDASSQTCVLCCDMLLTGNAWQVAALPV